MQMHQTKRHHFVPKAYLNAFCDSEGKLLVYRKDGPLEPLHVAPDKTQFRRYYYSQPTIDGGRDNNTLEGFFSNVEDDWPATVAKLHRREDVNDRLEGIFQFIALQRARVPACRDAAEAMLAQTVKDTMKVMLANGQLPPPPRGLEDLPDQVEVSIDPHKSIHAMAAMLQGIGKIFSMLGFAAFHNATQTPFLTSDNPVLWFDPSLPFDEQRPYTVNPNGGDVFLVFPVSPELVIIGSTDDKDAFGKLGLRHSDAPDESFVQLLNQQVCRFAYEAVISKCAGQEDLIAKYSNVSPVHEAIPIASRSGIATLHRQAFGQRMAKPKWRDQ